MTRKLREQRVTELGKVLEAEAKGQPFGAFGEYLGDIQVDDAFLNSLTNINPHRNSLRRVERGTYLVIADFDYKGDGHFIGLRLQRLIENPREG
jgi:hypothetical protein